MSTGKRSGGMTTIADEQPPMGMIVEEHRRTAAAMVEAEDYAGAVRESSRALDILPDLAEVAVVRGRGLLCPLLDKLMEGTEPICQQDFKEAYDAFRLALVMDPSNAEAAKEMKRLGELLENYVPETPPTDEESAARDAEEAHREHMKTSDEYKQPPPLPKKSDAGPGVVIEELEPAASNLSLDVIIVGAGAAGIGCAFTLIHTFGLDPSRVLLLERGEAVGTSFRKWPEEMRFISPSFNQQGWTNSFDLNSVAYGTSPAYTLHSQHPSGEQYADYLTELAEAAKLSVKLRTEVVRIAPIDDGAGGFDVHVEEETTLRAKYVVWAAGEFQYPRGGTGAMAGTELCVHNSRVGSWAKLPGDDFLLIGGYESGADAAINLAKAGKQATVLASTATWNVQTPDPSTELAPYTAERLRQVTAPGFSPRPKLLAPLRVERVERAAEGGFNVIATWKAAESFERSAWKLRKPLLGLAEAFGSAEASPPPGAQGSELVVHTRQPPVLCTGFEGSVKASARDLFNLADESDEAKGCLAGAPMLTKDDESTKVPGIFLVGPTVRHGELSFCFIYKFRQRFGIVANAICRGLGRDTTSAIEECRKMNMYLDDFKCCESHCGEAC